MVIVSEPPSIHVDFLQDIIMCHKVVIAELFLVP